MEARPVGSDHQFGIREDSVERLTGDVEDLPIIVVFRVVGFYQQAEGAGAEAGEFIPIRVDCGIDYLAHIAGRGWNNSIVAYRDAALGESGRSADRKGRFRVLTGDAAGLRLDALRCDEHSPQKQEDNKQF